MPDLTIVFWRDIPAQVIVGRGRGGSKRALSERFEAAIDRAAMRAGLSGTDSYLAQWRKAEPKKIEGSAEAAADAAAAALDAEYDGDRLRRLVENYGWA